MWLIRICLAMYARRRRKAAEGLAAMGCRWRLPGDRARFDFGRPVRLAPLLGSLLAWSRGGCSQPGPGVAVPPQSPTRALERRVGQGPAL
jgi:hypothetical protein